MHGHSFDLPVVPYCAMINGIAAPGLAGRSYFNRYSKESLELCDTLGSFSPDAKVTLDELSKVMGMPGKPADIWSEVERYFLDGRIKEIAEYCETEIVNTCRVWLRYELFCGRLTDSGFQARPCTHKSGSLVTADQMSAFRPTAVQERTWLEVR